MNTIDIARTPLLTNLHEWAQVLVKIIVNHTNYVFQLYYRPNNGEENNIMSNLHCTGALNTIVGSILNT